MGSGFTCFSSSGNIDSIFWMFCWLTGWTFEKHLFNGYKSGPEPRSFAVQVSHVLRKPFTDWFQQDRSARTVPDQNRKITALFPDLMDNRRRKLKHTRRNYLLSSFSFKERICVKQEAWTQIVKLLERSALVVQPQWFHASSDSSQKISCRGWVLAHEHSLVERVLRTHWTCFIKLLTCGSKYARKSFLQSWTSFLWPYLQAFSAKRVIPFGVRVCVQQLILIP